jgi:hypothetical protein
MCCAVPCCALQLAWVFNKPVDTSQFADYTTYVSQPMDFGTMLTKMEAKQYNEPAEVCLAQQWEESNQRKGTVGSD